MEISFGNVALPVILTIVLAIIYKTVTVAHRLKPLIAIGAGIALGLVALQYAGLAWTFVNVVNHVLAGLMAGAAAVGLYEGQKALINPREPK